MSVRPAITPPRSMNSKNYGRCQIGWKVRSRSLDPWMRSLASALAHIRKDENGEDQLDFETIIPMPPDVE